MASSPVDLSVLVSPDWDGRKWNILESNHDTSFSPESGFESGGEESFMHHLYEPNALDDLMNGNSHDLFYNQCECDQKVHYGSCSCNQKTATDCKMEYQPLDNYNHGSPPNHLLPPADSPIYDHSKFQDTARSSTPHTCDGKPECKQENVEDISDIDESDVLDELLTMQDDYFGSPPTQANARRLPTYQEHIQRNPSQDSQEKEVEEEKPKPAPSPPPATGYSTQVALQSIKTYLATLSSGKPGGGQVQLWQFLLNLLCNEENRDVICWDGSDGEFRMIDPDDVAKLWGNRKNKPNMTYDKMSRALRYYYDRLLLNKVPGKRYTYKFNLQVLLSTIQGIPLHEIDFRSEAERAAAVIRPTPVNAPVTSHVLSFPPPPTYAQHLARIHSLTSSPFEQSPLASQLYPPPGDTGRAMSPLNLSMRMGSPPTAGTGGFVQREALLHRQPMAETRCPTATLEYRSSALSVTLPCYPTSSPPFFGIY